MKKILLIIALLISGLGLNAQSVIIDDLEFTVTSETPAECEVSGYSGEPTDVTIPSTVTISGKEYTVTSIGNNAFEGCSSLTSIEIPTGVTSIGAGVFAWCSSLTSIEIPSGVTSIGTMALGYCFSLTSIEIPSGVTYIGDDAFFGCSSLTSIVVEEGNIVYDSRENCNAIIKTSHNILLFGCNNTVIPSSVTSIGKSAFSGCSSLTSIEIPSGVTYIGSFAFSGCSSLTSIEIPSGVTYIGEYAFVTCSSLTSIEIPSGVTSIEAGVFEECSSLTSIEIPSSVTYIGEYAFAKCHNLKSFVCNAEEVPTCSYNEYGSAFSGCYNMIIYVPKKSVGLYQEEEPWKNHTIKSITYDVTIIVNPEEAGVVSGAGTYSIKETETVTLSATANEGYKFVNWTENDTVVSTEAEYSFVITGDRNLVANFELLTYEVVASVNIENAGEITGAGSYEENDTVTLTAKANEGYKFINWTENDSVVSEVAEYTFVVENDREFVANFELLTYEVTASVNDENFGSVAGVGIYGYGEEVTLTATANEGYKFVNWTENEEVVSEEAEYSFVITGDRSLVANFVSTESISELEASFKVYPNPVSDMLFIEAEIEVEEVAIFDVYGRQQNLSNSATQQLSNSIDVSSLNNGVYFVKVVTSEGEVVKRFIKE